MPCELNCIGSKGRGSAVWQSRPRGADFSDFAAKLAERLANGKNIAIHSRQGIGQAALVAIGLLIAPGIEQAAAIERVGTARGCSILETTEQRRWIAHFEVSLERAVAL